MNYREHKYWGLCKTILSFAFVQFPNATAVLISLMKNKIYKSSTHECIYILNGFWNVIYG